MSRDLIRFFMQMDSDLIKQIDDRFGPQFEELTERATELSERLEADDHDGESVKSLTEQIEGIDEQVKTLTAARDEEIQKAQVKSLTSEVTTLRDAISAAREPHSDFALGAGESADSDESPWTDDSDNPSFFADAHKSLTKNDAAATARWAEAMSAKTMTQSSGSAGGYLVPPQVSSELLTIREQANVLRPLFSRVPVSSDTLRIAAITGGLSAGWVAELADKPESDMTFGEISVNTFWKAGMSVVTNQLLRNSQPSVDRLVYEDLAKRLAALEEIAFISGSGNGQPTGILNTPGVQSNSASLLTSSDVADLLDEIVDGITAIHTEYYGAPNAILMHPRTWGRIVKERKADATAEYYVGKPQTRDSVDPIPGYNGPRGSLFGLPVITTRNVPTNLGDNDNESRVIVGNFSEGLILDHAGLSLDASEHVYFTTNATIFRAEDAVGFTAARYPKAFYVIGGSGLANG